MMLLPIERIFDAIQRKSLFELKKELKEPGMNINAYHKGKTALHLAIWHEFIEGVEFLLSRPEVDVNLPVQVDENTPLHFALFLLRANKTNLPLSMIEIIRLLLKSPKVKMNVKVLALAINIAVKSGPHIVGEEFLPSILNHPTLTLNFNEIKSLVVRGTQEEGYPLLNRSLSLPRIHQAFETFSDDEIKALWLSIKGKNYFPVSNVIIKILMFAIKKSMDFSFEDAKALLSGFEEIEEATELFQRAQKMSTLPDVLTFCFGHQNVWERCYSMTSIDIPALDGESEDDRFVRYATELFRGSLFLAVHGFYCDEQLPLFKKILQSKIMGIGAVEQMWERDEVWHVWDDFLSAIVNKKNKIIDCFLQYPKMIEIISTASDSVRPFQLACRNNDIHSFKRLIAYYKSIGKSIGFPDPETETREFASAEWLKKWIEERSEVDDQDYDDADENIGRDIVLYYAALSVLKTNPTLMREAVFEKLKEQNFPGYKDWLEDEKRVAFYRASNSIHHSIADLFALTVFFCDGLLKLKNESLDPDTVVSDSQKFFRIMRRVPMEMQMKTCHVVHRSGEELVPAENREGAFKRLAAKF